MNYSKIIHCDVVNGTGCRTTLFVSGCRHCCKGCFNKEAWNFDYGKPFDTEAKDHVLELLDNTYIDGLTLLGGEPMDPKNQSAVLDLVLTIRQKVPNKTIWLYSGYQWEDLMGDQVSPVNTQDARDILANIDVLVDGKFIEHLWHPRLKYRGSSNQRIIDVPRSIAEHCVQMIP